MYEDGVLEASQLQESDKEIYDVLGFDYDDSEIIFDGITIKMQTYVNVKERLKAETVDEIPYVNGYLDRLGIDSYVDFEVIQ